MGHSDQSDSSHQSEPGKFKERVTDQNSRVPGKRSDTVIQMVGRNTARPKVKSVPLFAIIRNHPILFVSIMYGWIFLFRGIKLTGENLPSLASPNEEDYEDVETYLMSKSYFDLKEYDRCNFFTANCKKSPR